MIDLVFDESHDTISTHLLSQHPISQQTENCEESEETGWKWRKSWWKTEQTMQWAVRGGEVMKKHVYEIMVKVSSDHEMSSERSCNYKVVIKHSMARKTGEKEKGGHNFKHEVPEKHGGMLQLWDRSQQWEMMRIKMIVMKHEKKGDEIVIGNIEQYNHETDG